MDWPSAVALTGASVSAGAAITAAIIKYVPPRNGRNGNGKDVVSGALCSERRSNINDRIGTMQKTVNENITALGTRIGELREDIQDVFKKIDEINTREINKAAK